MNYCDLRECLNLLEETTKLGIIGVRLMDIAVTEGNPIDNYEEFKKAWNTMAKADVSYYTKVLCFLDEVRKILDKMG